jgi:hypothetical protein
MFRSRFARTIGLGMTIAALGASTAGAQPADLRSPDAIDAGQPQTTTQYTPSDLRSPDALSAGQPKTTEPVVDMRTPDAKDHGEGRGTFSAPDVTVVKVVDPQPTNTGFDWGDAGIGAGGLLGLALIALGGTAAVAHHRHRLRTPSTV